MFTESYANSSYTHLRHVTGTQEGNTREGLNVNNEYLKVHYSVYRILTASISRKHRNDVREEE